MIFRSLASLFSPRYPKTLVHMLQSQDYRAGSYLNQYWHTNDFSRLTFTRPLAMTRKARVLWAIAVAGMLVQIALGLILIWSWHARDLTGGWQFGAALLLSFPLVWAHLIVLFIWAWWLLHPKALGRSMLCALQESQVRRLRKRHDFTVVAVVGSVGKTSTKMAIASLLGASKKVLWQEGNYNDRVTVPLIFFEHNEPGIFNVPAWLRILITNERTIRRPYPYDVVVAEFGPDGPGQMQHFAYVKPELVVLTAISPEHMEFFGTLDAVAEEELTALSFAKHTLVNIDDTPEHYLTGKTFESYGLQSQATYHITKRVSRHMQGQEITFQLGKDELTVSVPLLGDQGAKIALAAAATGHTLKMPLSAIKQGLVEVSAFAGRMQVLAGIKGSTLIDDTYNSSPIAAKAALDVLQNGDAPQRIAILGSMNELGAYSPEAHREVGAHCDPTKLDWVITVGDDAKQYLAPVAKERGCQVKSFTSPYKAGAFVKRQLKDGAVVLAKGSQNRVFTEESLKPLLADKADEAKLVRQSGHWIGVKSRQFSA
jgi:UDP-N-acetylmuramoyl-tripeptide--D-alanyl-D-alanine ligase